MEYTSEQVAEIAREYEKLKAIEKEFDSAKLFSDRAENFQTLYDRDSFIEVAKSKLLFTLREYKSVVPEEMQGRLVDINSLERKAFTGK